VASHGVKGGAGEILWRGVHGNQEQIDLVVRAERREQEEQEKDGRKRGKRSIKLILGKENRGTEKYSSSMKAGKGRGRSR
jgi:hypothetical protein